VDLVLLRHVGLSPATVRVTDPRGKEVLSRRLPATGEPLQYASLRLPAGGPFRVELDSQTTRAWDLLTAQPTRRVFHVPDWKHVEALTPRAYFRLPEGAAEIKLTLAAQGEGFKGAVVYDPSGAVAGALSRFIDYGDEKPHTYELTVPVKDASGKERLWGLGLQNVAIARAEGVEPYIATNPEAYFKPARAR
jgi:hypothetical protein